jgi:hypothetical protein
MEPVWRSRACSLTFCGPRGKGFPGACDRESAAGCWRRGRHRARAIQSKIALCASTSTSRPRHRGCLSLFWAASPNLYPNLNLNLLIWITADLRSPSQPGPQKTAGLAPIRTKSHQIAPKKICAWQKRAAPPLSSALCPLHSLCRRRQRRPPNTPGGRAKTGSAIER